MDIPAEITLQEIVQSNPVSNSDPTSTKDEHQRSKRWLGVRTSKSAVGRWLGVRTSKSAVGKMVLKEILNPEGPILQKWNWIFVISCLFAVLLDPLFVYIPLINQDMKCIELDKHMEIAAVILRSITDLVYIMKIIFQVYELEKVTVAAIWRSYILLDILAVLPIPQVTILIYFTKMRGSRSLNTRKFLNFLVLIQYVPRVLRIYLACKEIKNSPEGKLGLWIKGGLNFLMYIFASHILGGFWYFFSVQRMIDCWQYACEDEDGCKPSTFNCQDHRMNNNIKLLNDSCPINPSDATVFDFGIFLDALQSGLVGSTDYSQKLSNCFWWGLRNLSSLGSNLQPSIHTWENLFASLTSIIGLLLFLYLIGNLQVESASKEQLRWKTDLENMMRSERKLRIERSKGPDIEQWLKKNGLPVRLMPEIMEKVVQVDFEQNRDVDVENILSILPLQLQRDILVYKEKLKQEGKRIKLWLSENHLPMRLKSEIIETIMQPEFEQYRVLDVNNVVTMLSPHLRNYIESYMQKLREKDEEIDRWLSENDLPAESYKSEIMKTVRANLEENNEVVVEDIFSILPVQLQQRIKEYMRLIKLKRKTKEKDEEIDLWMLKNGIPGSKRYRIVEAVELELDKDMDIDVENFLSIYQGTVEWIQEYIPLNRLKQQVKLLEKLDERVLEEMCKELKPVKYDAHDKVIIEMGKPLEMILFVEGAVCFGGEEKVDISLHEIWGQELLHWPMSISFPAELPVATETLSTGSRCSLSTDVWSDFTSCKCPDVTAFVLTATDMESIGSKFKPQFDLLSSHWLTWLKKVPKLQSMDEEVLKAIFLHLKKLPYPLYCNYYVENVPVKSMNFIVEGSVKFTRGDDDDCEELFRRDGEVYGEEILDWVLDTSFPTLTPIATHTAIYDPVQVAVLSITAEELKSVGSKFRSYFITLREESQPDLLTYIGLILLRRVPKLQSMDEEVLKAISQHLKFEQYGPEEIIAQKGPFDKMMFLLRGCLFLKNDRYILKSAGPFIGEVLIDRLTRCSDATRPLSKYNVVTGGDEENQLLVLMANDLESVVSKFKSHFS